MKFVLTAIFMLTAMFGADMAMAAPRKKTTAAKSKPVKQSSAKPAKSQTQKPAAETPVKKQSDEECEVDQNMDSDSERVLGLLQVQSEILQLLQDDARRIDLARLQLVQKAVSGVRMQIQTDSLAGKNSITIQTINLVQHLIIKYRFSKTFFGWDEVPSDFSIYTDRTSGLLQRLRSSAEELTMLFGFDDSPYTTITATTFGEMEKSLRDLGQLGLDPQLSSALRSLIPQIGRTVAIAKQGDRPCAFSSAYYVAQAMRSLYPSFDQVATSSAGFSLVMDLQGLTEFYAEYSQLDQQTAAPPVCGVP